MHQRVVRPLVAFGAALLLCPGLSMAQQSTTPPIKPGLWQMNADRSVDGKKAEEIGEQLKNMPPAAKQQIEAIMKQRGVDISGGASNLKLCLNRESLDAGQWQRQQGQCKTDYVSRTSSQWKWHTVCTSPKAVSDGEATFSDAENYVVKTSTTMAGDGGASKTMALTITGKWLSADCGDVKPVSPKAAR